MNSNDFEDLISFSQPTVNPEKNTIDFIAYKGYENYIAALIKKHNLQNLSINQFTEIANTHMPVIQTKRKLHEKYINDFINMSPKEIAKLSLEKKIEYIENIFHKHQTNGQLKSICSEHKDKLKSLLYHIQLPKDFWKNEEAQANRFISLVANNQHITNNMKNWHNLSLDEKKSTLQEVAKTIEYVYDTPLKIGFYTPEEYRKQNNLPDNAYVFGAYHCNGDIFFNTERLENSDNYMGVSVLFHEFMHKRQHEVEFNNPLINRLFDSKLYNSVGYEMTFVDNNSLEYGDIYSLMPGETHAFAMQKYVEDSLTEKTGIKKTQAIISKTTQQIQNKSYSMSAISRYNAK